MTKASQVCGGSVTMTKPRNERACCSKGNIQAIYMLLVLECGRKVGSCRTQITRHASYWTCFGRRKQGEPRSVLAGKAGDKGLRHTHSRYRVCLFRGWATSLGIRFRRSPRHFPLHVSLLFFIYLVASPFPCVASSVENLASVPDTAGPLY